MVGVDRPYRFSIDSIGNTEQSIYSLMVSSLLGQSLGLPFSLVTSLTTQRMLEVAEEIRNR